VVAKRRRRIRGGEEEEERRVSGVIFCMHGLYDELYHRV
jgi:hypothetical protein